MALGSVATGSNLRRTETVSWLVLHHLLMSKTAFRYDLNDPQTINDFAAMCNHRTVKIIACFDCCGYSSGWTCYLEWLKAALMRELYRCDGFEGADPAVIVLAMLRRPALSSRKIIRLDERVLLLRSEYASHLLDRF